MMEIDLGALVKGPDHKGDDQKEVGVSLGFEQDVLFHLVHLVKPQLFKDPLHGNTSRVKSSLHFQYKHMAAKSQELFTFWT